MGRYKKGGHKKTGDAGKKPSLTHFLCIPLVNEHSRPQLQASLQFLKEEVAREQVPSLDTQEDKHGGSEQVCSGGESSTETPRRVSIAPLVPEKAVRPVDALHLTLGVMSLDEEKLEEAKQLLQKIDLRQLLKEASSASEEPTTAEKNTLASSVSEGVKKALSSLTRPISPPLTSTGGRPLTVSLKSLESMHPPRKTSILYTAPKDPLDRLYPFADALRKRFADADLLVKDTRPLKLHATIVNTIYAKKSSRPRQQQSKDAKQGEPAPDDRSKGHGPNAKAPLRMDATPILEKYKDYVWAEEVTLDRIAICEMGAKKILDDEGNVVREEYKEVATARLVGS
ncbi:hypothetical protein M8818_006351 [Zalaria obscura]|uniref:Uncharacterized protein n=1 Tax=Zalaria obscura TaxID=2024903 RepID=A0ACC3S8M9_9PEZI